MVVYHGTADDFGAFDLNFSFDAGFHFGTADAAALRLRHLGFFTDELDPDHGPHLIPVYLSIRNPKRIDTDPYSEDFWGDEIEKARREGHDGIVYVNEVEGGLSWIAFRPEQIKSAIGNCGTFDPGNPLITR